MKETMNAAQAQRWDDWAVHQAMNEKQEARTRDVTKVRRREKGRRTT